MSVVEDFKGTTIVVKIAFVLLFIATLFTCIAYPTTYWGYDSNTKTNSHYGVWRICPGGDIPGGCTHVDGTAVTWYGAFQAFVTVGFFGTIVTFLLCIFFIFIEKCQKNGEVGFAAGILGIITGICYLIGCIIFGAEFDDKFPDNVVNDWDLGYSFALAIVAVVLLIVGAVLMIVAAKGGGGGGKTQSSG